MARQIGQRTLIWDQGDSLIRKRVRWPAGSSGKIQVAGVALNPGDSWDFTIDELLSSQLTSDNFADPETPNSLYYVGAAQHPTLGTAIGDYDDDNLNPSAAADTSSIESGTGM